MLAEKQKLLIERYAIIPDVQERLMALVQHAGKKASISDSARIPGNIVPGCVSRVWIEAWMEEDRCRFRSDADSPMVKGLAGIVCELYDGAPANEIPDVEPVLFEAWGIAKILTPTRLNGLSNIRHVIRAFATAQSAHANAVD